MRQNENRFNWRWKSLWISFLGRTLWMIDDDDAAAIVWTVNVPVCRTGIKMCGIGKLKVSWTHELTICDRMSFNFNASWLMRIIRANMNCNQNHTSKALKFNINNEINFHFCSPNFASLIYSQSRDVEFEIFSFKENLHFAKEDKQMPWLDLFSRWWKCKGMSNEEAKAWNFQMRKLLSFNGGLSFALRQKQDSKQSLNYLFLTRALFFFWFP